MFRTDESSLQQEIMSWLLPGQIAYLATVDSNNPKVRPITLYFVDGTYRIVTFSGDSKVLQILHNSRIEMCVPIMHEEKKGYIRLNGTATIVTDAAEKRKSPEYCLAFQDYYTGIDDPSFALIACDIEEMQFLRPGETYSQNCILKRS